MRFSVVPRQGDRASAAFVGGDGSFASISDRDVDGSGRPDGKGDSRDLVTLAEISQRPNQVSVATQ
jgi:hypothetical protein